MAFYTCLATLSLVVAVAADVVCPPEGFDTQGALEGGFDLKWYTSAKWYVQQQMIITYLPKDYLECVTAEYTLLNKSTFFGYDVQVDNHAENKDGKALGPLTTICAKVVDEKAGKTEVSPCFLPTILAGKYWVIAFNQEEGWSLVSGGPPTIQGENGCRTGTGTNNSGLWIFTRKQQRDPAIIAKVRALAQAKGFDLSVLMDVDQTRCAATNVDVMV